MGSVAKQKDRRKWRQSRDQEPSTKDGHRFLMLLTVPLDYWDDAYRNIETDVFVF